ncbi:MAG: hypothetical protein H0T46_08905 [Deltaproteobacteria bacterium]|nr:hypothetical protein [Deltaproteobacteria bacterium]
MRKLRGIRVAATVVWFITVAAACVRSANEPCGGSLVCSAGTTCIELTREGESGFACASQDQIAACEGKGDGMGCTFEGADGSCLGGACLPSVCGDGINDPVYEMCDDGNVRSGDGCSGDCKSLETCGNNLTDLEVGEQCDEGSLTVTGDGCSFHCQREYRLWRDLNPTAPQFRTAFALATDPVRGAFLVGGTQVGLGPATSSGAAQFNDSYRWDDTTWLELRAPSPIPNRASAAMANDHHGRVLMVGGVDDTGAAVDDAVLWDGVTWKKITGTRPSARFGASLACAMGTATLCILFGGQNGATYFDDVWKWNGSTWTPLSLVAKPLPRRQSALAYDNVNKRFVMYGGVNVAAYYSDMWSFENDTWTQRVQSSSPAQPHPSTPPSAVWSPTENRIVMLAQNLVNVNHTWTLDGANFTWLDIGLAPPTDAPQLVWSNSPARLLAISPHAATNSLQMFALSGVSWSQSRETRPTRGNKKTPAAYDEKRGVTVVLEAGTFEWNGIGWRMTASGAQSHPTSDGAALAYQAQCSAVIAFGGGDPATPANRNNVTSRYPQMSGLTWAPFGVTGPGARTRHAMTYDRTRKAIVVFGGLVAPPTSVGSDTWELTTADCQGWTWTEAQPSVRPPARSSATLVYDEKRNVSVLFGGADAQNATPLNDTWEWDGTTWKQRMTPATGTPDARFEHMAAYDPRRQKVLLFGGRGSGRMSDVWEFDGVLGTWVRIAPAINPVGRNGSGFALDVTGNLVAFNGDLGTSSSVAVIRLSSELSTEPPEACARATDDMDGDGLAGCMDPDCWGRCTPLCPPGRTCAADAPRCGNTTCDPLEDHVLCPGDCPSP